MNIEQSNLVIVGDDRGNLMGVNANSKKVLFKLQPIFNVVWSLEYCKQRNRLVAGVGSLNLIFIDFMKKANEIITSYKRSILNVSLANFH